MSESKFKVGDSVRFQLQGTELMGTITARGDSGFLIVESKAGSGRCTTGIQEERCELVCERVVDVEKALQLERGLLEDCLRFIGGDLAHSLSREPALQRQAVALCSRLSKALKPEGK